MRSGMVLVLSLLGACAGLPEDHRGRLAAERAMAHLCDALRVDHLLEQEAGRLTPLRESIAAAAAAEVQRLPEPLHTAEELWRQELAQAPQWPARVAAPIRSEFERAPRALAALKAPDAPWLGELHPEHLGRRLRELGAGLPHRLGLDRPVLPSPSDPERNTDPGPPPRPWTAVERIAERLLR